MTNQRWQSLCRVMRTGILVSVALCGGCVAGVEGSDTDDSDLSAEHESLSGGDQAESEAMPRDESGTTVEQEVSEGVEQEYDIAEEPLVPESSPDPMTPLSHCPSTICKFTLLNSCGLKWQNSLYHTCHNGFGQCVPCGYKIGCC